MDVPSPFTDQLKDSCDDDGQEPDPEEDEQGRAQADGRLHSQRPAWKGEVATRRTVTLESRTSMLLC